MLELTSVAGFAAGRPGAISAAKSGISEAKSRAIACASERGSKGVSTYAESRKPARGTRLGEPWVWRPCFREAILQNIKYCNPCPPLIERDTRTGVAPEGIGLPSR